MGARVLTLLVWAAVAGSAVVWGLKLGVQASPVPAQAVTALPSLAAGGDLGRVFGQAPAQAAPTEAPVVLDNRFKLVGVVAPRNGSGTGLALISVDGKPAKAVRVGRELEPGLTLVAVGHRQAELGRAGAASVRLELPALPEAQRGRPAEDGLALPAGFGAMVPGAAGIPMMQPGQAPLPAPMPMQRGQALRMPPPLTPGMTAAMPVAAEGDATPVGAPRAQDGPSPGRMSIR